MIIHECVEIEQIANHKLHVSYNKAIVMIFLCNFHEHITAQINELLIKSIMNSS